MSEYNKLSVIIPVYNEEDTVLEILERVNNVSLSDLGLEKEIIVVDDGSTDTTRSILKENSTLYTELITKENAGKGSAIRRGFQECSGDIIIVQDADLEYDPGNYQKIIEPIIEGRTQVVYGSRFKGEEFFSEQRWGIPSHFLGNKLISSLFSLFYFVWISDLETCYKCFIREVLEKIELTQDDFKIEVEISSEITGNGYDILEVPIDYTPRTYGEGKKIGWKDGLRALGFLVQKKLNLS